MALTLSRLKHLWHEYADLTRHRPRAWRDTGAWLASLWPGRMSLSDNRAWLTFPAQRWLVSILTTTMRVFEYGSGGSTILFARRVAEVVSIEHDETWYANVKTALIAGQHANCTTMLLPPERVSLGSETIYRSDQWPGWSFEKYVRAIDAYPDKTFDLVLVDGRARLACVRHALPKIRPGGYLVVDNTDRSEMQPIFGWLATFPRQDFTGFFPYTLDPGQTSVWHVVPSRHRSTERCGTDSSEIQTLA